MKITYMYNGVQLDSYPSKYKTIEEAGIGLNNKFAEMWNNFECEVRVTDDVFDVDSMEEVDGNIVIELSNKRSITDLL